MSSKEWLDKYNQMIDLANELYKCPNYIDSEIHCSECRLNNKCSIVSAIITLSGIK